ncbi:MAG: Gfo/Idh/MocA family oxidoreductase [Okeania sp. SIO2C9]|uniref:Gfo/Idh/MocA family protein n=1 Tax=Okeania sp. SIO2C9 TaxID=2607791 RepID=UPI0013C00405|nr:Gfo/Idh/MocA family oxidoreductase [Okeania sp. SIO2C9]NEQ72219.1 Gfo/Idh/MocA family oxidoreductase [Okeania sp. SIO2C9]
MEIGIAIFGAGRWGTHLIRNFCNHPQSRVIAIVDPNLEQLQAVQKRLQLDQDIALLEDWTEALELPGIEAVAIATPASTHYEIISAALKKSYHVLSEKPLTLEYSESVELCKLAEQQQRQLFIDHTYLFNPVVQSGQAIVAEGKLGELRYGYATRTHIEPVRPDVDALWDLAIHDICILNSWLNQKPVEVQANGTVWLPQQPPQSDLVMAKLTYPSGFQAFLHLCWLNPDKQRRLGVVGTQGTLIFDEMSADAPLVIQHGHLEEQNNRWKAVDVSREVLAIAKAEPLAQVCNEFLNCIRQNTASQISSGWVGAELVGILCALNNSLEQGGKIVQCNRS